MFKRWLIMITLLTLILEAFSVTALSKDMYAFDLKSKKPSLFKAYKSILPSEFLDLEWFSELNGVSGPLTKVNEGGVEYLVGQSCEPHNCYSSRVKFMISSDGKRAIALLIDEDRINGALRFLGSPTNKEIVFLIDQK